MREKKEEAALKTQGTVEPRTTFLLMFWLSIAVLLTVIGHLAVLDRPFDYSYAWASAHFSTMARAFVEHGVVALGGVPIQNNSPLGLEPDTYIHFPPLFPIVLSGILRIFGESESAAHGLMLVVLLANALALYALVEACCDRRAGLLAALTSLVMPVTLSRGHVVLPLNMAILGMLLALLGFIKATGDARRIHRGWAGFGGVSLGLAILTSWEPLLVCPGLLVAAIWHRRQSQIRLALLYSGIAVSVFGGVMIVYLFSSPHLTGNLWQVLLFRTGLVNFSPGPLRVHTVFHELNYSTTAHSSLTHLLWRYFNRLKAMGPLPIVAVGGILVTALTRRHSINDSRLTHLFAGLMAPWLLWFVFMANHAFVHDYQMLLAVPPGAAALGVGVVALINLANRIGKGSTRAATRLVTLVVLPMAMLIPMTREIKLKYQLDGRVSIDKRAAVGITFAHDIKNNTEPGAVVIVPDDSMVPVYYSERHIIRGVYKESLLEDVVRRVPEIFPQSEAYLALRPADLHEFPRSLGEYPAIAQTEHLVLLALPKGNTTGIVP